MSEDRTLGLFEGYGIELEYMIVDADSLDVRPVCDQVMAHFGGGFEVELEHGACSWSNELALHVLEIKTNGPAPQVAGLGAMFQENIARAEGVLEAMGGRLMPAGMHPWMDPHREMKLWPHEYGPIYRTYDRIFDCRGHGWANLQSTHINLPFKDDAELGRLHAAIRLVLPLVPSLAASSPFMEGRLTGLLDNRLEVYRHNSKRVPEMAGVVVPESASTRAEYQARILEPIYAALAPLDPEGILHHEWANSRGCIARFDRMALEIRLLDIQECPRADMAVAALVVAAVRGLVEERWAPYREQVDWDEKRLAGILLDGIRDGDSARIEDKAFREALGWREPRAPFARDLWERLIAETLTQDPAWESEWKAPLETYLGKGCLARRLVEATTGKPADAALEAARKAPSATAPDVHPGEVDRGALRTVYRELADCLRQGRLFGA